VSDKPSRNWRRRIAELAVGFTVNKLQEYLFDFLLYPFVIFKLGLLCGGIIMSVLSFIGCLLFLRFYDWSKRDWLGIEAVKSLKDYSGTSRLRRFMAWLLCRGDYIACVTLSVKFDPFITTAYLRRGAFNGMNRRDWRIFVLSWFVGNAYWSVACFFGVSILAWVWLKLKIFFSF